MGDKDWIFKILKTNTVYALWWNDECHEKKKNKKKEDNEIMSDLNYVHIVRISSSFFF